MKTNIQYLCFAIGLGFLASAQFSPAAVVTLSSAADAFINSNSPDNNAGAHGWFDAGADGVGGVRRGLIRFNLASIPAGSTINSAVLQLTVTKVPSFGPVNSSFQIHRLDADWTEGTQVGNSGALAVAGEATWNSRMSGSANWTVPGAASDAEAAASASTPVGTNFGASYTWTGAAVASDVQFWLDHPAENFGWLLRSDAEGTGRTARGFGAREDAANAGRLQVTYTPSMVITNPIANRIPKGALSIELRTVADGMVSPLGLTAPDDGSGRLFVYDQSGLIWLVTPAGRAAVPMLDIRSRLIIPARYDYDERGLLGVAAHPNFPHRRTPVQPQWRRDEIRTGRLPLRRAWRRRRG